MINCLTLHQFYDKVFTLNEKRHILKQAFFQKISNCKCCQHLQFFYLRQRYLLFSEKPARDIFYKKKATLKWGRFFLHLYIGVKPYFSMAHMTTLKKIFFKKIYSLYLRK